VQRFAALGIVLVIGLITWVVARWLGARLRGATRFGLSDVERLAAPVSLLALAAAAALLRLPLPGAEWILDLLSIGAATWLGTRLLDVASGTAKRSTRLRALPAAPELILAGRQLGKVLIIVTGAAVLAVRLGVAEHLYLMLGGIGAALAFAARDPIRNAIAFASMLLDPPYQVGDRIRAMDFRGGENAVGQVLSVSLTSTTIESDSHTRIVISNTMVGQLRVENLSAADRHRLELIASIPRALSTEALREACELIERDLAQSPHVTSARAPRVWLSGVGEGVLLKASAWLRRRSDRRQAQHDLMLSIRARLQAAAEGLRPVRGRRASGRRPNDIVDVT